MFLLSLLIAFGLGYGVREIISRRRRAEYLRRHRLAVDHVNANELDKLGNDFWDEDRLKAVPSPAQAPQQQESVDQLQANAYQEASKLPKAPN